MLQDASTSMSLYGVIAALTIIAIVAGSWSHYLVDVRQVRALLASGAGVLLHVDAEGAISPEHAARGLHIPLRRLGARVGELPTARTIVVCAHDGRDTAKAMTLLRQRGYRVRSIADENLALVA